MHPFSALPLAKLELIQLQLQARALEPPTRLKYHSTAEQYFDWLLLNDLNVTADTATLWATSMRSSHAPSTIDQKLSHLQFFSELGVFPPIRCKAQRRLIQGLQAIKPLLLTPHQLLPSTLLLLHLLHNPTLIHTSILLQALVGLRGGQMILISPAMLKHGVHVVPPFKKTKFTTLLPLSHVNPIILQRFIAYGSNPLLPILHLTKDQYRRAFSSALSQIGFKYENTTHSARHTFGSIQWLLTNNLELVQQHLIHKSPKTTKTYIHVFDISEQQIILQHPELFQPIQAPQIAQRRLPQPRLAAPQLLE